MSQIKKVSTVFKTLDSLLAALKASGVPEAAIQVDRTLSNTLPQTQYGGYTTQNALSVRIQKTEMHGYEDTGFRWNATDKVFEAAISSHSGYGNFGQAELQAANVQYSRIEARRLAVSKGYTVTETTAADGTIRLTCKYTNYSAA